MALGKDLLTFLSKYQLPNKTYSFQQAKKFFQLDTKLKNIQDSSVFKQNTIADYTKKGEHYLNFYYLLRLLVDKYNNDDLENIILIPIQNLQSSIAQQATMEQQPNSTNDNQRSSIEIGSNENMDVSNDNGVVPDDHHFFSLLFSPIQTLSSINQEANTFSQTSFSEALDGTSFTQNQSPLPSNNQEANTFSQTAFSGGLDNSSFSGSPLLANNQESPGIFSDIAFGSGSFSPIQTPTNQEAYAFSQTSFSEALDGTSFTQNQSPLPSNNQEANTFSQTTFSGGCKFWPQTAFSEGLGNGCSGQNQSLLPPSNLYSSEGKKSVISGLSIDSPFSSASNGASSDDGLDDFAYNANEDEEIDSDLLEDEAFKMIKIDRNTVTIEHYYKASSKRNSEWVDCNEGETNTNVATSSIANGTQTIHSPISNESDSESDNMEDETPSLNQQRSNIIPSTLPLNSQAPNSSNPSTQTTQQSNVINFQSPNTSNLISQVTNQQSNTTPCTSSLNSQTPNTSSNITDQQASIVTQPTTSNISSNSQERNAIDNKKPTVIQITIPGKDKPVRLKVTKKLIDISPLLYCCNSCFGTQIVACIPQTGRPSDGITLKNVREYIKRGTHRNIKTKMLQFNNVFKEMLIHQGSDYAGFLTLLANDHKEAQNIVLKSFCLYVTQKGSKSSTQMRCLLQKLLQSDSQRISFVIDKLMMSGELYYNFLRNLDILPYLPSRGNVFTFRKKNE